MPDWETEGWQQGAGVPAATAADVEEPARGLGVRRAFLGGMAGVALLVGPVGLAQAIVPEEDVDVAAGSDDPDNVFAALGDNTDVVTEVSQDRLNQALAAQPATIAEKPAAPTTTSSTTTTEPPEPEGVTPPPDSGGGVGDPSSYATWDALAACESGGNWSINNGNGYYGGLQFSLGTWQSLGGSGYPHEHSRETQIAMGQELQARSGWGQWPGCTSKLGWI